MKHGHRFTLVAGSAVATVSLLCGAAAAGPAAAGLRSGRTAGAAGSSSATPAEVRVNQVGYATGSPKVAFVMLPGKVGQVSFTVSGRPGVVFRGRSSTDAGSWNAAYGAVYRLDFSGLNRAGTYRITARAGRATAVSPVFKGMMFMSIEDETGIANAIIAPDLLQKNRALLISERFLVIEGILQNQDNVIHIRAEKVFPLTVTRAETVSHDFH